MKYKVEIQEVRRGFIIVEADTMENAARLTADAYMSGKTDWITRESKVLQVLIRDEENHEWERMR